MKKLSILLTLLTILPLLSSCGGDDTESYLEKFLASVYSGRKSTPFLSRMHPILAKEVRMKSLSIFNAKENLPEKVASHSLTSVKVKRIKDRKFLYGFIREKHKNGTRRYRTFLAKYKLRRPQNPKSKDEGVWILYDLIIKKGRRKKAAQELLRIIEPSQQAKQYLSQLKKTITILIFDTRHDTLAVHFLKEIAIHSKDKIKLEFLNPYIERGSAAAFQIGNPGYIVVMHKKKIYRINRKWLLFRRGKISYFQGERILLPAIRRVDGHNSQFMYITGHGEKQTKPGKESHWSKTFKELSFCGFEVMTAPSISKKSIGTNRVICMAAPLYSPSMHEIQLLRSHLSNGGTLLMFIEKPVPATLRQEIASWGIEILPHTIVDPSNKDFIKGPSWFECNIPDTTLTEAYTSREDFKILMGGVVGMRIRKKFKTSARAHSFVTTTSNGWAEASYEEDKPDDVMFTPGYDIRGPIALSYSISRVMKKGRVLLFGDSDFISDKLFTSKISNWIFFLNSLDWLTDREAAALSIRSFQYRLMRSFL